MTVLYFVTVWEATGGKLEKGRRGRRRRKGLARRIQ